MRQSRHLGLFNQNNTYRIAFTQGSTVFIGDPYNSAIVGRGKKNTPTDPDPDTITQIGTFDIPKFTSGYIIGLGSIIVYRTVIDDGDSNTLKNFYSDILLKKKNEELPVSLTGEIIYSDFPDTETSMNHSGIKIAYKHLDSKINIHSLLQTQQLQLKLGTKGSGYGNYHFLYDSNDNQLKTYGWGKIFIVYQGAKLHSNTLQLSAKQYNKGEGISQTHITCQQTGTYFFALNPADETSYNYINKEFIVLSNNTTITKDVNTPNE